MPYFDPFKECPGYSDAVEYEQNLRDAAFVDGGMKICGVPIQDLTLEKYIMLVSVESPFLINTKPTAGDVLQALWFLSPEFVYVSGFKSQWKRHRFIRRHRKLNFAQACAELHTYFERSLYDAPKSGHAVKKSFYSWVAGIVDLIASEYGWSEKKILTQVQMRRLLQYCRTIQARESSRPLINPSERFIGMWLKDRNEKNRLNPE